MKVLQQLSELVTKCCASESKGEVNLMGKLDGKVAVITAGTLGMALATAKLFVAEGAYVFVTGRDQSRLDQAVKEIGQNVTGIQGDFAKLDYLDRLYERVARDRGHIDVLFASAG
jgi:NAD(P)-dependent dehydrogenase (short-subunit alcohol dehydrogenase family)